MRCIMNAPYHSHHMSQVHTGLMLSVAFKRLLSSALHGIAIRWLHSLSRVIR